MQRLHTPLQAAQWLKARAMVELHASSTDLTPSALQTDSRCVNNGDVFMAWPGESFDARHYIEQVLDKGAKGCLVHEDVEVPSSDKVSLEMKSSWLDDPRVAFYPNLKAERGRIASAYFGEPSAQLKVTAITGTNGKSTCAWWLTQALSHLGCKSAMAGTLGQGQIKSEDQHPLGLEDSSSSLTTMEAVELQACMRKWVNAGVTHLCMEASSIGLKEARLEGTCIEVGVFTNLTQDHLDYHANMDEYWAAKELLFSHLKPKASVINLDDSKGAFLYEKLKAQGQVVLGYSTQTPAHPNACLYAKNLRVVSKASISPTHPARQSALLFEVVYQGLSRSFKLAVMGEFNVSNLLAVVGSLLALGYSMEEAMKGCEQLSAAPGRMQSISLEHSPLVVIDYAHTPDAIEKALSALKPLTHELGGKLWCVMGCGGERDPSKRSRMGAKANALADRLVLTSDNPRYEDAQSIVEQIKNGVVDQVKVLVEMDRRQAIALAIQEASNQDVVLIAGKGHENYQDIRGVKHEFSDAGVALELLKRRTLDLAKGVGYANA